MNNKQASGCTFIIIVFYLVKSRDRASKYKREEQRSCLRNKSIISCNFSANSSSLLGVVDSFTSSCNYFNASCLNIQLFSSSNIYYVYYCKTCMYLPLYVMRFAKLPFFSFSIFVCQLSVIPL